MKTEVLVSKDDSRAMKPGDRVIFVAKWSSYKTLRGTVVSARPLMVCVDGDAKPICVSRYECVLLDTVIT